MRIGRNMRGLDVTVAVDHGDGSVALVNGQDAGPAASISGDKPPLIPKDWWPYILGAAALGALWWLVKDDAEEEGAGVPRPFAE